MTEVLIKYYLNEAKLKSETRLGSARQRSDGSKNTLTELRRQMTQWEADVSGARMATKVDEDEVSEAQAYFQKRNQNVIDCLKALVQHVAPSNSYDSEDPHSAHDTNYKSSEMTLMKTLEEREPPQIVSGRRLAGLAFSSDQMNAETQMSGEPQVNEIIVTGNSFDAQPQVATGNSFDAQQTPLNIVIGQQNHGRNPTQVYSDRPMSHLPQSSMTMQPPSVVSPQLSCRNCTATFTQTQSMRHDVLAHYKTLFQKFLQTGRSLAGICYGGSMFMGDQLRIKEKRSVDYALSFLAKDSSDFETATGQQGLDELWTVVDNLLTCLSKIVSGSCQTYIRANSQLMDAKRQSEAFDSIHQKSMELSIDQNHQISRLEHGSFCDLDSMKNTTEMIQQHQASNNAAHAQSIASAQVGGKMIELEQRIKSKFSNIKSLESLLDSILGK